jgi:hypothetical protein
MKPSMDRAKEFLSRNARLLERRRYSFLFERGGPEAVKTALQAYLNDDGGYGHALEPDLRGPESEPIPAWTALGILDETRCLDSASARPIIQFLRGISLPAGGVPFVLHAASQSPHAPWWETKPGRQPPSLNPTAGVCGLLYRNRIRGAWLTKAAEWCWTQIDTLPELGPYEARVVLQFLDNAPDQSRASETLERLRPALLRKDVIDLESSKNGDVHRPLDLSPEPGRLSRSLFADSMIERNLDAVEGAQHPDGGWSVSFPIWTPLTQFEWRGIQTLEMLKVLCANGRPPRA